VSNIFLAPRSNETSHENFASTIQDGVPYSLVKPYLSEEDKQILSDSPTLKVWGCKEKLRSRWEKMEAGDYVLFYAKGGFNYSARVVLPTFNEALGRELWPNSKTGEPWTCLFFIDQVKEVNIPIKALQGLAGYEPTWDRVQGFMKLNKTGTEAITEQFGSIESFIDQPPQVFLAIEKVLETIEEESIESEADDGDTFDEEWNKALAHETLGASHKEVASQRKVRIENRTQKRLVARKEGWACQICNWSLDYTNKSGKTVKRIDVDHIIEKSDGGGEEVSNLWVLCPNCHVKKTLGVITIDPKKKLIQEKGQAVELHHDSHLGW